MMNTYAYFPKAAIEEMPKLDLTKDGEVTEFAVEDSLTDGEPKVYRLTVEDHGGEDTFLHLQVRDRHENRWHEAGGDFNAGILEGVREALKHLKR